jgi:hypothetical protein
MFYKKGRFAVSSGPSVHKNDRAPEGFSPFLDLTKNRKALKVDSGTRLGF